MTLVLVVLICASQALAQSAIQTPDESALQIPDESASRFDFDISSTEASTALTMLASQADATILVKHDATSASVSPLTGRYTLVEALDILLQGSGLEYALVDQAVIVGKAKQEPAADIANTSTRELETKGVTNKSPLEELMVTSRKRAELLQDTPISITALSSELLERRALTSLDQISEVTPNLVFDNATAFGPANSSSVIIRGIGLKDFTLVSEPGVGLYVDDMYIPHSIGNVADVVDVERIEVLRGPQGTLFGRNTIGGAVRVITKKPSEEFEAKLQLNAGSFKRIGVKSNINIPITKELFVRLSGLREQQDGFIGTPNLASDNGLGDKDVTSLITALRWLPSNNFTVDVNVGYSRDNAGRAPSLLVSTLPDELATGFGINAAAAAAAAPNSPAPEELFNTQFIATSNTDFGNEDLGSQLEVVSIGLTLDWTLSDSMGLKSITSYRDVEVEFYTDLDHSPLRVVQNDDLLLTDSFSQEIQLYGDNLDGRLYWTIGAYYFDEQGVFDDQVTFGRTFEIFSGGETIFESIATFGQASYNISESLSITAGLRRTRDSKDWLVDADHQFFIPPRLNQQGSAIGLPDSSIERTRIVPIGTQSIQTTSTDPYLNIAYKWSDSLLSYISYSQGFKGGGFQERNAPGSSPDRSYNPEFATVYEFGSKWSSTDHRYTLNGAVFYTDYTNLQLNVVDGIAREIRNAGEAEVFGFELEFTGAPTDALTLAGGVGYLQANYTEVSPAAIAGGITIDNELPNVPEWQLNLDASYAINTDVGSFVPRLGLSYSAEQFNDGTNNPRYSRDSYVLLEASLTFLAPSERLTVSLTGKNLSNEQFFLAGFEDATFEYTDAVLSRPREWFLSFAYKF